ncbi:MAG: SpoIIE family protein phosphatase [Candidatus Poribacteria bacterium]
MSRGAPAMAVSGSDRSHTAWLDNQRLEDLALLAVEAPDAFREEFDRLDVLRRAQVRRFLFERHRAAGPMPEALGLPPAQSADARLQALREEEDPEIAASLDKLAATEPGSPGRGKQSTENEKGATLPSDELIVEPTDAEVPNDTNDASPSEPDAAPPHANDSSTVEPTVDEDVTDDGTAPQDTVAPPDEFGSLDDMMAMTSEPPDGGEVMSLDDLFAEPAAAESDSLDALFGDDSGGSGGGDAMSLDDLFADSDSGGGEMSLDDLMSMDAPTEEVVEEAAEEAEEAGAEYPIPSEYGVAIPVELSVDDMCALVEPLPLYAGIAHDELFAICEKMEAIEYEPGSLLCRHGDDGDVMWLIRHGGIRVLPQGKDLDIVKPEGSIVGEMALLDGAVRSATLVCEGRTILLRFSLDAWTRTFRDAPEAGLAFLRNLARMQQDEMRRTTEKAVAEAAAKAAIESEFKQAEETQKLALPDGMPDYFGESDCAVIYTGARGVSGDYYDFIEFEDDPDRIIVIFADSTGHGLNAGLLMLLARSAAHTQSRVDPSVAAITKAINDVICEVFGATLFMTYVAMLFDRNAKTIEYTNAGQQSHPYLYRMASGEFDPLASQTFQLGIQGGATYTSEVLSYEPGDLLVCYSDGIIEAPYCPPGATEVDRTQEFGDDRIEALIVKTSEMEPQDVIDELQKQAREWCVFFDGHITLNGVEHDGDDITNLVVRLR